MAIYTDFIGSGTALAATTNDYPTLELWYAASGSQNYNNGDELRVVFQSSADGHNGSHPFKGDQKGWTETNDITITFSSTNLVGSGLPNGWLHTSGDFEIQSASSSKVFNFRNLDFYVRNYAGIQINRGLTADATCPKTVVNFDNCRIVSPSAGPQPSDRTFEVGNTTAAAVSGVTELNFTNCILIPYKRFVFQESGDEGNTNKVVCNLVGCGLHSAGSTNSWFWPSSRATASYEVHMSGCLANFTGGTPTAYNGVVRSGVDGYTSGTATDYISNEPATAINTWANSQTNVSDTATFLYGAAPSVGEVAFSGGTFGDNPYDLFTMDLRLWEDSNNIAIGYASNTTLPSPDLANRNRFDTPYDVGPFEMVAVASEPGSSTSPTFKMVQVNLYN